MGMHSDVIVMAQKAISETFPEFRSGERAPEIIDQGEEWKFIYNLSDGSLGGSPVVIIDKKTKKIIKIYRTQ